jgi:hypothetical protein
MLYSYSRARLVLVLVLVLLLSCGQHICGRETEEVGSNSNDVSISASAITTSVFSYRPESYRNNTSSALEIVALSEHKHTEKNPRKRAVSNQ